MNKRWVILLVLTVGMVGCNDDENSSNNPSIDEYLSANNITNFTETESGLKYVIEEPGLSGLPVQGEEILIHYTGSLTSGLVFDSSIGRKAFWAEVGSNSFISGFAEGLAFFSPASKGTLYIPSILGYGSTGVPGVIASGDDLIFDIERLPNLIEYIELNEITEYEETASGLIYQMDVVGSGDFPIDGKSVRVHYTLYSLDDRKLDSSIDRNETFEFLLGEEKVISGFEESVMLLKTGGTGVFYLPPAVGYGTTGSASVAPNQDLKFEIELVEIVN